MYDRAFLIWLLNRLVHQYGEDEGVDFCGKLASIIDSMSTRQLTPNTVSPSKFLDKVGRP